MVMVVVFLAALVPILFIGATLIDLLMRDAPRRGKRPDDHVLPPPRRHILRVVTPDGRIVHGTPCQVVRQVARDVPLLLTPDQADQILEQWESVGLILVRGDWD
jgi:hypothetical protein